MRHPAMYLAIAGACALAAVTASRAEPAANFGLGDGHWGPLNTRYATLAPNRASTLRANASGTALEVDGTQAFAAGDLVMVYQATDVLAVDSGVPGPFDLGATGAGRWELARIAAVAGGTTLSLTAPLQATFPAGLAQVLVVPEYTTVTIPAGSTLLAAPWDGQSGGVLAFLAQGRVVNEGEISASGAGFRGGATNATQTCSGQQGLDGPPNAGKGEGLVAGRYGPAFAARGNVANGGGGGNLCNAGGGGGGNGGPGGKGGYEAQSFSDMGGLGGAALAVSGEADARLPMGGGGGAGQGNHGEGGAGGRGGGVVWFRALDLRGGGAILADGEDGAPAGPINPSDGAGGGGAGGTISIRLAGHAICGQARALGGDGGSTPEYENTGGPCGPGGGGGGGRILLQAENATGCPALASSGLAGVQPDTNWPVNFGATPDASGMASHAGVVSVITPGLDAGPVPSPADAGQDAGNPGECVAAEVGCGCSSSGSGVGLLAVALALALAALRRTRAAAGAR